MLFKIISIFLIAMVLIALVGRALFPGALPRMMQKRKVAPVCPDCGRPVIGTKPCDCRGKSR